MAFRTSLFLFFLPFAFVSTSHSLPFVFFHGLLDECSSDNSIRTVSYLKAAAGVEGQCIEIGNGSDDAFSMPILDQIQIACDKVKELEYLREGFNIFGVSQGTLIARGLLQFCDGAPPVKNFISLAGPQAGVAAIPFCENIFGVLCPVIQAWFNGIVYSEEGQDFAAPATYYKLPNKIEEYLKYSRFLPKLNNERPEERNSTYKERFSSLHNLVLLANENESVLIPKETAWFGYYKDGSTEEILPAQETDLYKEDWIGLRSLNELGRVKFYQVPGVHAEASDETLSEFVVPFFGGLESAAVLNHAYQCLLIKNQTDPLQQQQALKNLVSLLLRMQLFGSRCLLRGTGWCLFLGSPILGQISFFYWMIVELVGLDTILIFMEFHLKTN